MSFTDAWWELTSERSLVQGDLLQTIRVFWLPDDIAASAGTNTTLQSAVMDCIVMSASCDLDSGGFTHVLVAQIVQATQEGLAASSEKEFKERYEVVRKGLDPSKFMLARCPRSPRAMTTECVVVFKRQYQLPIKYVIDCLPAPRPRLRHPFREKFGNWVGECFSRVGPDDSSGIPPNGVRIFAAHLLRATE